LSQKQGNEFENAAREERKSFIREYVEFLGAEKKYWLIPLVGVLLLLAALVTFGGSAAPFIYTLF
jgi:hypothetical protein